MRFKHFNHGSDVVMTIREGEKLRWSDGGPTDEGWFSVGIEWELDEGVLRREIVSDGADCDGRHTDWRYHFAAGIDEFGWPVWKDEPGDYNGNANHQYDQFAEMMNY